MFCVTERTGYKTDAVLLTKKKVAKLLLNMLKIFSF